MYGQEPVEWHVLLPGDPTIQSPNFNGLGLPGAVFTYRNCEECFLAIALSNQQRLSHITRVLVVDASYIGKLGSQLAVLFSGVVIIGDVIFEEIASRSVSFMNGQNVSLKQVPSLVLQDQPVPIGWNRKRVMIRQTVDGWNSLGGFLTELQELLDFALNRIRYSCVLLDTESRNELLNRFGDLIPDDWRVVAHHMTITLGGLFKRESSLSFYQQYELDALVTLPVVAIGGDNRAIAVRVSPPFPLSNRIAYPHVTLAVNVQEGAKPVHSNEIPQNVFRDVSNHQLSLNGRVTQVI